MAYNIREKNGNIKPIPRLRAGDIKIVVVGERKCGKSSFIREFTKGHFPEEVYQTEGASVYRCKYDIDGQLKDVAIIEIISGPDELLFQAAVVHRGINGFVFMYAIDDPISFEKVTEKWMPLLDSVDTFDYEPAIVVGTKRDLRENQQVIQRLAQNNQVLVTSDQGASLAEEPKIKKHFECSSLQPYSVNNAFYFLLNLAYDDLKFKYDL